MKIILCIIVAMLLTSGCSDQNKNAKQQDSGQNIENASNDSKSIVEQVMDDALKNSIKTTEGTEVVLKDKLFIAQCNDIYLNPDEYMGKTIRWEGIYTESTNPVTGESYKFVIRYGPGCCGNDGTAGFEILYDKETPNLDDWVEAVGEIEMVEENGKQFVAIRLSELTVLDVRGQEFVSN